MYKVIVYFTDLHDNDHEYHEGDIFPREGILKRWKKSKKGNRGNSLERKRKKQHLRSR